MCSVCSRTNNRGGKLHMMYELIPIYDSRKSFYKKAIVYSNNGYIKLQSYSTIVAMIDINKGIVGINGIYSATTLRHIKEFLKQNGYIADTQQQILKDYYRRDMI